MWISWDLQKCSRRIDRIAIPSHQLWSATMRVTSPSLSTKVILPSSFTMKVVRTTITSSGEDCRSELCHVVALISFDIAGYSFNQWMMGAGWLVVYYNPRSLTARPWKMLVGRLLSYWERWLFRVYVKLPGIFSCISSQWSFLFPGIASTHPPTKREPFDDSMTE